jgi:hypothetical protein
MLKTDTTLANEVILQILELSADAHIARRRIPMYSPLFHHLTGAIAAYGKVLAVLTSPRKRQEVSEMIGQLSLPECVARAS